MAFKNLFSPNVASTTKFLKNTTGWQSNRSAAGTSQLYSIFHNGDYCLEVDTPGQLGNEGIFCGPYRVSPSLPYTFSVYADGQVIVTAQIAEFTSSYSVVGTTTTNLPLNGTPQRLVIPRSFGSTAYYAYGYVFMTSPSATKFYLNKAQLEQNDHATSYEFPGLDLTGNSITSNEAVQNLKLNQELKLFTIASEGQVQNLTVENILQLLQVPSSEYVNNLEICNSIFLEAIESTETVNELIAWVACEFMKCNITMKTPKTVLSMKYPLR